jgi:hypothetical protein
VRAFVYRNLNKPGVVWSVRNTKTGRVAKHAERVLLEDVDLAVGPGGRARVLREKRKNVHAGARGQVASTKARKPRGCVPITYNPYKNKTFVRRDNGKPVKHADKVFLGPKGACAVGLSGLGDVGREPPVKPKRAGRGPLPRNAIVCKTKGRQRICTQATRRRVRKSYTTPRPTRPFCVFVRGEPVSCHKTQQAAEAWSRTERRAGNDVSVRKAA